MKTPAQHLAASARLPNLPSVVSNVWLGIAMAAAIHPDAKLSAATTMPVYSGLLLCLAGNFLNDWADREWDKTHRPERALPRLVFPPSLYLTNSFACMGIALVCALASSPQASVVCLAIIASILIYTWSHKKTIWSVIPMGLCRGLLPVLGFAAIAPHATSAAYLACLGLLIYITGLTLGARFETLSRIPKPAKLATRALLVLSPLPLLAAALGPLGLPAPLAIGALIPVAIWLASTLPGFARNIPKTVSALLAGLPLLDAVILFPLAAGFPADGRLLMMIASFAIPVITFLAAIRLQRHTPAT
ncbi:MAG: UbiA family prenyltransferase [Verrucomicrobiales bacterium]|nr:UbiA family prenyltransferase [Verrucomicrobiota bacterium JB025]